MVRIAGVNDTDEMKRMALDFFNASPYKPLGVSERRVDELCYAFVAAPRNQKICFLWEADGKVSGMLAAAAEKNLCNDEYMAGELVWWIDSEQRKSKAAAQMIDAYEYWALRVGCQICTLVDLLGNLDKYYQRKGYERRETTYLKVL